MAVLPLANLSGDPSQEYFADGITEALITELAKIRSLRVVSRTSVMRYRGTKESIPQIARALRVQAMLEGSVMKSGDRFRITAQLIHAGADQHLWAETYEGATSDILEVQARVARDVAAGLRAELAFTEAALAYALGRAGRVREAERALAQLTERYAYVPYWFYSIVSIGLDDTRRALEALENAFRDHEPCLVSLKVDPVFDPLRQESGFSEMIRRVGLEP